MEYWKDIEGFDGLYQISNFGNIKSVERKAKHWRGGLLTIKSRIMKPFKSKCGYLIISISKESNSFKYSLHRLTAIAFIPNPEKKTQVNHINGIKTDNRLENLEWSTASENIIHADKNNLRVLKGINNSNSILTEVQVLEIRSIGKSKTQKEISEMYNVGFNCISKILNRKTWSHV